MKLTAIRLKPNPSGKDVTRIGAAPSQLAGEWVDVRNDGATAFDLSRLQLDHRAYAGLSGEWKLASVLAVPFVVGTLLGVGYTLRVHSGRVRDLSVVRPEDRTGADLHGFTGRDAYIWNNNQADTAAIWNPEAAQFSDWADYEANPPEGAVLIRHGKWLVPATGFGLGTRR